MNYISDVPAAELKGKRVLVRAGLDVPLDKSGNVSDKFRIKQAAKTLRFLSEAGAKVIVLSHIGRKPEETNEPVARALVSEIHIVYIPDLLGLAARQAIAAMKDGEVLLLENLRRDEREAGNDDGFARELASLGDMYVDDAFSVAHRAHASIVGIPKYIPGYAGILMRDEVDILTKARNPDHPSFAILGGAKFETKSPLIKMLLETYDHLFVTGALANDVFKANGLPVGISLISKELPSSEVLTHTHFLAPIDVTVERPDKQVMVKKPEAVAADDKIVDIGPDSVALVAPYIAAAKFILWNGPTGLYEDGFVSYTQGIAELIAKSGARVVIGGGDTIAVIEDSETQFGPNVFLSTGGGAMLEFLLDGTLPGIQALNQ
jgi:phosphoglycerate kinase